MTDSGNHGGLAYAEVATPLVVCPMRKDARQSQRLLARRPRKPEVPSLAATAHDAAADGSWRVVAQADIAVTLALLLGVPVPRNSVRKLILEQFRSHSVA